MEEFGGGGMEFTEEGSYRGSSMQRRWLSSRQATLSSLKGDTCQHQTSVCFSLERGEGDGVYEWETTMGGGLFTTPSSMPTSQE